MSDQDILSGSRWNEEISRELAAADVGVLCLTKKNVTAPWLIFEAGALSREVGDVTFGIPYLIDLELSEVPGGPLSQYQGVRATREGTRRMLKTMNAALALLPNESVLESEVFERAFNNNWPDLEKELNRIKNGPDCKDEIGNGPPDPNEMIAEILVGMRDLQRALIPESRLIATGSVTRSVGVDHPLAGEVVAEGRIQGDLTTDRTNAPVVRVTAADQGFVTSSEQAELTQTVTSFESIDGLIQFRNRLAHSQEPETEEAQIFRVVSLLLEEFLARPRDNTTISNIKILRRSGGEFRIQYDET
jgi:hypothetical protein